MNNPVTRITPAMTQPGASVAASAARAAGLPAHVLPADHDGRREAQAVPPIPFSIIAADDELTLRGVTWGNGTVLVVKDRESGQVSVTYVPTPA